MKLGSAIKSHREAAKMTQNAVARASGIDQSQISKIESGKTGDPATSLTVRIANAIGVSVDDLVAGVEFTEEPVLPNAIREAISHAVVSQSGGMEQSLSQEEIAALRRLAAKGPQILRLLAQLARRSNSKSRRRKQAQSS